MLSCHEISLLIILYMSRNSVFAQHVRSHIMFVRISCPFVYHFSYHALISCSHIMLSYHALISCFHIMLSYHVLTSCSHIMLSYHALISCSHIMLSYHVLISCSHIMFSYHALISCPHIMLARIQVFKISSYHNFHYQIYFFLKIML